MYKIYSFQTKYNKSIFNLIVFIIKLVRAAAAPIPTRLLTFICTQNERIILAHFDKMHHTRTSFIYIFSKKIFHFR